MNGDDLTKDELLSRFLQMEEKTDELEEKLKRKNKRIAEQSEQIEEQQERIEELESRLRKYENPPFVFGLGLRNSEITAHLL